MLAAAPARVSSNSRRGFNVEDLTPDLIGDLREAFQAYCSAGYTVAFDELFTDSERAELLDAFLHGDATADLFAARIREWLLRPWGLAIRQRSNGSDIDTFIRACKKPPSGTPSDEPQFRIPGLASPVSKFIPSLHPLWWRDVPSSPSDSTIRIANVIVVHRRDPHLVKEIEYSASKLIPSATDGVSNTRFLCTTMSFIFGERRRSG